MNEINVEWSIKITSKKIKFSEKPSTEISVSIYIPAFKFLPPIIINKFEILREKTINVIDVREKIFGFYLYNNDSYFLSVELESRIHELNTKHHLNINEEIILTKIKNLYGEYLKFGDDIKIKIKDSLILSESYIDENS